MVEEAGWTRLRVSDDGRAIEGWSFALHALGLAHRVQEVPVQPEEGGRPPGAPSVRFEVWVAPAAAARAAAALDAHDREERERADEHAAAIPDHGRSFAGLVAGAALLLFFLVTGERGGPDGAGWFRAGSAMAERIVEGQWWRAVTALTLHADLSHVLGNAGACAIFLTPVGRWLGDGLALWLTILAGTLGNLATAFLFGSHHDSVGASTATFGALGLLGGLQIVRWLCGRRRARGGLRRAWVVLAACLGLFAMLGVGPRSDVLAHVTGLGAGLGLGVGAGLVVKRVLPRALQLALVATSAFAVVGGWALALR